MLTFDVTNKTSFDELNSWLQEFRDNGGKGAVVIVVGNKVFYNIFYTLHALGKYMFTSYGITVTGCIIEFTIIIKWHSF